MLQITQCWLWQAKLAPGGFSPMESPKGLTMEGGSWVIKKKKGVSEDVEGLLNT